MIIIVDKKTKKLKKNFGTNSAFPDGNMPGISCQDDEEIIMIATKKGGFPTMETMKNFLFREVLKKTGGNQSAAARILDVSQATLSLWLKGGR